MKLPGQYRPSSTTLTMASFFFVFSIIGLIVLSILFLACFAMGLLALCEYVEQKPNFLKKIVKKIILTIALAHLGFIIFDCISFWRLSLSLLALALHYRLHLDLPKLPLIPALVNGVVMFANHFMWLGYFFRNDHPLMEVVSFYFFMVWAVPISIAISYSTSELLPGFYEESSYKSHRKHY